MMNLLLALLALLAPNQLCWNQDPTEEEVAYEKLVDTIIYHAKACGFSLVESLEDLLPLMEEAEREVMRKAGWVC